LIERHRGIVYRVHRNIHGSHAGGIQPAIVCPKRKRIGTIVVSPRAIAHIRQIGRYQGSVRRIVYNGKGQRIVFRIRSGQGERHIPSLARGHGPGGGYRRVIDRVDSQNKLIEGGTSFWVLNCNRYGRCPREITSGCNRHSAVGSRTAERDIRGIVRHQGGIRGCSRYNQRSGLRVLVSHGKRNCRRRCVLLR